MRLSLLVVLVFLTHAVIGQSSRYDGADEYGLPDANRDGGLENVEKEDPSATHKDLFPLATSDIVGITLAAVGLMVAAGGGIGGGGVLVPIYILAMYFHPPQAIPLANVTIFGGSIANCILNLPKRHPVADRPLIDFDLVMVMEPLTIAGAVVGSIINKMAPEWLITFCLIVTLAFTANKTWQKGFKTYEKERDANEGKANVDTERYKVVPTDTEAVDGLEEEDDVDEEQTAELKGLLESTEHNYTAQAADWGGDSTDFKADKNTMVQQLQDEERHIPFSKVMLMVICFVGVLFFNVLKGGKGGASPIGVKCGSGAYWFLNLAVVPFTLAIALWVRNYLLKWYAIKQQVGYKYVEGDVKWDNKTTIVYPMICTAAGLCAGMFGIGGGIVKGPLMLEMGVIPSVSSATAAFMILFTTASAASTYVIFGMLKYDYAVPLFFVGFICTYIGQKVVDYLVKKYNNSSYIIFSIAMVITMSCLLMGYQGITSTIANWGLDEGHGICD